MARSVSSIASRWMDSSGATSGRWARATVAKSSRRFRSNTMPRSLLLIACLALSIAVAGCGSSSHKPQQVHGKSIGHWVHALKERNPAKRRQAVRVLGNLGIAEENILPALIHALRDPAP